MQSLIHLPLTNLLCSLEMIKGIKEDNLSARTLDMILNLKLAKAIGLQRSIESTLEVSWKRIRVLDL